MYLSLNFLSYFKHQVAQLLQNSVHMSNEYTNNVTGIRVHGNLIVMPFIDGWVPQINFSSSDIILLLVNVKNIN